MVVVKVKPISLPIDIESNILSRLPIKTIIRFRSAQKSWYSLVSTHYFINMHRNRQNNNNNNNYDNLLIKYYEINHAKVKVVTKISLNAFSTFKDPYSRPIFDYGVVGSSNGLVCIQAFSYPSSSSDNNRYLMEYISLWNPALRINKIIFHKRHSYKNGVLTYPCVGFGFHNQTNDYKVIRFQPRRPKAVKIYSLSSGSWRDIECADSELWRNYINVDGDERFGVYVNDTPLIPKGAFCWLDNTRKEDEAKLISFDMGDEVFNEMMLPPVGNIYEGSLFSYKGSLAVLERLRGSDKSLSFFYVWVMKEYNDPKSWTQLCKCDASSYHYKYAILVGIILQAGPVLITGKPGASKEELCMLDIDRSQIITSFTKDIRISKCADYVSSFTESLVLLDVKNKRKRAHSN